MAGPAALVKCQTKREKLDNTVIKIATGIIFCWASKTYIPQSLSWSQLLLIIHLGNHDGNYHPKARDAEAAREQAARLEVIMMEQREASQPPVDAFLVEVAGQ